MKYLLLLSISLSWRAHAQTAYGPSSYGTGMCYGVGDTPLEAPVETLKMGCASKGGSLIHAGLMPDTVSDADKINEITWALQQAKAINGQPYYAIGYDKSSGVWKDSAGNAATPDNWAGTPGAETCAKGDSTSGYWLTAACTDTYTAALCASFAECSVAVSNSDHASTMKKAGESFTITCNAGAIAQGTNPVTCNCPDTTHTAAWLSNDFKCLENKCTKPTGNLVAAPDKTQYAENDVITISCANDLTLVGDASVTCTRGTTSLEWSPALPQCTDTSGFTAPPDPVITYSQEGLKPGYGAEYDVENPDGPFTNGPTPVTGSPDCDGIDFWNTCWTLVNFIVFVTAVALAVISGIACACITAKKCARPTKFGVLEQNF